MGNQHFDRSNKDHFSDYNREEIRGSIIDHMNTIETNLNIIICDFIKPVNKDGFNKIILNSSIISLGAKLKILRNIESFDNKIITQIQQLSSIRNAFAHVEILERLKLKKNGTKYDFERLPDVMDVMNSSGEIKRKKTREEASKFFTLSESINTYLTEQVNG